MRFHEAKRGVFVRRNSGPGSFVPDGPGLPSRGNRIGVIHEDAQRRKGRGPVLVPVRWLSSPHIETIAIHRLIVVPPEEGNAFIVSTLEAPDAGIA